MALLLFEGSRTQAEATTIISIKYPQSVGNNERTQPAKRDLSLSYAATNIDSKEGTRVKTITVIKSVGGNIGEASTTDNKQQKFAINPELYKNEEWASAFRDNFDSYGVLPDVPDIDDLFEFVNRKKSSSSSSAKAGTPVAHSAEKGDKQPELESTTTAKSVMMLTETATVPAPAASEQHEANDEPVEKIKGDAELLPHIKQANILRLQALAVNGSKSGSINVTSGKRLRTRESLINVNYSTPMHAVMQYFDNYVQALPNGYDYSKPCALPPPNSISVTTPSGRTYDIPQSNSSGTGGGNHPYLAPSLTKKTVVQGTQQSPPPSQPNYSSVNSLVPPIQQPGQGIPQPSNVPPAPLPPSQQQPAQSLGPVNGISTSQRPYVAPSLRNNGLGINRGPPTPPPLPASQPPAYRPNVFIGGGQNRPNTFRSRGLKY
ncbi:SH3 domain-containing protein C23A1.17 [Scaptodrosophila lebanonensis]|uniref:SH3 domain-containing protein C23A1.17 n=1 Tax=Drosophila lebanonensis TaxID=7225 RepID=A0A6J2UG15_DROLE|nr:SH3 domain-containing protein C23A1.17 [Scaptodrosophila lebanonensis]